MGRHDTTNHNTNCESEAAALGIYMTRLDIRTHLSPSLVIEANLGSYSTLVNGINCLMGSGWREELLWVVFLMLVLVDFMHIYV